MKYTFNLYFIFWRIFGLVFASPVNFSSIFCVHKCAIELNVFLTFCIVVFVHSKQKRLYVYAPTLSIRTHYAKRNTCFVRCPYQCLTCLINVQHCDNIFLLVPFQLIFARLNERNRRPSPYFMWSIQFNIHFVLHT